MPSREVVILARAVYATFRLAAVTVIDDRVGRLDREVTTQRLFRWSRSLIDAARIDLSVYGRENLPPGDESFVVMSNHQSHYDVACLFQAIDRPLRMVGKRELFRIPVMGAAMRATEFVEVDRQNHARAVASLAQARKTIKSGISVWIAPEGTRSDTGRVAPFKKGGFYLALETGARILPVTVEGTRFVLPARSLELTMGLPVSVTIGAPIDSRAYGEGRRAELIEAVRASIVSQLPAELRD